tara:strand:+ start:87 stop:521 length:435 start_codon:yes stop_codon:yes gene_type:complete
MSTMECPNCMKEVSPQKVKNNFNLCYLCNYSLSNSEELRNLEVEKDIQPKPKNLYEKDDSKITVTNDKIETGEIYEYPALTLIIVLCKIFSVIGFIASIIIASGSGFRLEALLIMGYTWIGLIILYSYTELIKIFIRIEKNTRK